MMQPRLIISWFLVSCSFMFFNCSSEKESSLPSFDFEITELSDAEYPDNPDIGFRSEVYENEYFGNGQLVKKGPFQYDFIFHDNLNKDSILVPNVDIKEYIPTIPSYLKGEDDYLCYISLVNQEWNRNQVRFYEQEFKSSNKAICRVDVARNCLNAYLWEVIAYTKEAGKELPIYHGWFDFPHDEYATLFNQVNEVSFKEYAQGLENWIDPANEVIDPTKLRKVKKAMEVTFQDLSDAMYPIEGARKKKLKEIIYPTTFETMRDLQTDSALFATFTPPGFYNTADPRTTELGRFVSLENVAVSTIESNCESHLEALELAFEFKDAMRTTKLVFGGIEIENLPILSPVEANKGWKSSMGIGNHPFYETYGNHLAHHAADNPYYAYLADGENHWLDSHKVGIDGPILHRDADNPNVLHVWLLSFERHALVGHYTIDLSNNNTMAQL